MDVFDAGDDEAHFTGFEICCGGVLGREDAHTVDLVDFAGGFYQHLVAFLDAPVAYPHQRYHTQIIIEPGIDDQRLQWRLDLTGWRRDDLNQTLEHVFDTHTALGAARDGIGGIDADDVLDLFLDALRLGLGQVHLIQDRHDLKTLLDGGVAVGDRLRLDTLPGIDHQQSALTRSERTADFIGEVDVARRVDEIQLVCLSIIRLVMQRDAVGLDGNTTLTLEIHRIQHLSGHFSLGQATAHLDEPVRQCGLAVINVGDDGEIADMTQVTHSSTLGKDAGRLPAENSREV